MSEIKYLIEVKKLNLEERDKGGRSVLMFASRMNPILEVIKYLIESCGCDINETDICGNTALFHAAYKNPNINVLKYFVEDLKCDVNAISGLIILYSKMLFLAIQMLK